VSAPDYREYAPRAALRPFVHCVWTFTSPPDDAPQRITPDGRPEFIVHVAAPYRERHASGDVAQAPVLFAGQLTAPLTLMADGAAAVTGVRLHAWAARAFLGVDAEAATDRRLDLTALHGDVAARLRREVRATDAPDRWIEIAQDYVAARLVGARIDDDVRAAIETMVAGVEPHQPASLSERQWQRRFKAETCISQQQMQSVLRFRRVFDAIEHPQKPGWVEAALAAGYLDQPQMARDFRRYLGCTARAWAAQQAGLAKALTAPESYKSEAGERVE
jgi:AraC-like DNA-binding protein